jgi:hypothetical protein
MALIAVHNKDSKKAILLYDAKIRSDVGPCFRYRRTLTTGSIHNFNKTLGQDARSRISYKL